MTIKNMIYIDSFYGYFICFPFIFIGSAERELSRNFFMLIFEGGEKKELHFTSFFNSKYNLSHKGS